MTISSFRENLTWTRIQVSISSYNTYCNWHQLNYIYRRIAITNEHCLFTLPSIWFSAQWWTDRIRRVRPWGWFWAEQVQTNGYCSAFGTGQRRSLLLIHMSQVSVANIYVLQFTVKTCCSADCLCLFKQPRSLYHWNQYNKEIKKKV